MIRVQTEFFNRVAFHKRYDKEEIGICGTCAEGFEWFVTSTDTGWQVGGKKKVGCPIRIWMNDIWDWSLLGTYGQVKRAAEDRKRWKLIVVNLRNGVDK